MPILGSIIKRTINIRGRIPHWRNPYKQQVRMLRKLLTKAQNTAFGQHFHFEKILLQDDIVKEFQSTVKTYDYSSIYKEWWYRALKGEPYVCWPSQIKYFALSSGTSEASSKYIPVTKDMLRCFNKAGVRQILTMGHYDLPKEHFQRGTFMMAGSTALDFNGIYYEGDLSGITTSKLPLWFHRFYKPGREISKYKDWDTKISEIVKSAKDWDIGIIVGVPAWIQILLERIIEHYKVKTIHDVWPNLRFYFHAGVAIGPYVNSINKLTKFPLIFSDSYLASEGYIAFQERPNEVQGMRMLLDNGLFYEFVPFNENNFDADGNMKEKVEALTIKDVELGTEYALLLSTCSGAWRYLIGDVIKFTDLENSEIVITGRTKHFLSLCGEHLSVDNMTRAIKLTADELGIEINEFTVAGIPYQNLFAHHWYVGVNKTTDATVLKNKIDNHLKNLNDDYRVERISALKEVIVTVLPDETFIDFLGSKNRVSAASKFPRVMKGKLFEEWKTFLENYKK